MLSAASEKLQINFRCSLWSLMLADVTMPWVIAAAAEPQQRYSKTRRRNLLTSINLNCVAVSRGTAALVLAGMLVLGSGLTAWAQSEDAGLKGTWRLQVTVRDCQTGQALRTFPALFAFAKGGTLTVTTAGQLPSLSTPGLGVWRHTDGHTYNAVSEAFVFSPAGAWTQTHRLTRVIEISNDANEFTDTVALQIFDTNGNLIVTGCATSVASRFE
jgi:hypothetical protein